MPSGNSISTIMWLQRLWCRQRWMIFQVWLWKYWLHHIYTAIYIVLFSRRIQITCTAIFVHQSNYLVSNRDHAVPQSSWDRKLNEHCIFTLILFSNSVQRTRQVLSLMPLGPPFNVLIRGMVSANYNRFSLLSMAEVGKHPSNFRHIWLWLCIYSCWKISQLNISKLWLHIVSFTNWATLLHKVENVTDVVFLRVILMICSIWTGI